VESEATRQVAVNPGRERLAWTLVLLVLAALALRAPVLLDDRRLLAPFMDDAFYDLQIARNVVRGLGPTFDGIHPTNGFHPLWVVLLLPIVGIIDSDFAVLRAVSVVELALACAAAALVYRTLLPRAGHWPASLAALVLVASPGADTTLRTGLEGALVVLLAVLAWRAAPLARTTNVRAIAWLGVLCGLLALARLEAAILAPILVVLARLRGRALLALVAPWSFLVGSYTAYNLATLGIPLPVSALVKAYWQEGRSLGARIYLALNTQWPVQQVVSRVAHPDVKPWLFVTIYLAVLVAMAAWALHQRAAIRDSLRACDVYPLVLLAIGTTTLDVLAIGVSTLWQATPLLLGTALVAGAVARPWPGVARAGAAALAALALWKGGQSLRVQPHHRLDAYAWLATNVADDERVGSWTAGAIGWFSHRQVVPLDGLVNEPAFLDVLRSGRLHEYLVRERIDVLTDILPAGDPAHPLLELLSTSTLRYERVLSLPLRETVPDGDLFVVYRRLP